MNKQEKYKVFNYSNSVCFLTCGNHIYQVAAWKNGVPGFANVPFEEIEFAAARTALFRFGVLGFEEKHKEEFYKELHIDEENVWTRDKIYQLLVKGDKHLRQLVLNTTDRAAMSWIRGEAFRIKKSEEFVLHSVVTLIDKRNLELMHGQIATRLVLDESAPNEKPSVNREEFDSLKQQNEELSNQVAKLLALLEQRSTPTAEAQMTSSANETEVVEKPAVKRASKKKE